MMLYISKSVLHDIETAIVNHPPERGGAILGPVGQPIITRFLLDEEAHTSGASYLPSPQLTQRVQQLEIQERLEFKGIIHSHPGGLDRPSGPDETAMLEGLNLNPHIPYFVAPIVTLQRSWGQLREHELPLGRGKISCYVASRDRNYLRVETLAVKEVCDRDLTQMLQTLLPTAVPKSIPLRSDLQKLCQTFGSSKPPEVFITEMEGQAIPAGRVILDGDLELLFLASESYPVTPPMLMVTPEGGNTEQIKLDWLIETPAEERLLVAVKNAFAGSGPYQKVYGPLGKSSVTADADRARLA
ncbi:MAG: Mov34/MPN/PAD-1 family protein, partial [Microcoleus sp.]